MWLLLSYLPFSLSELSVLCCACAGQAVSSLCVMYLQYTRTDWVLLGHGSAPIWKQYTHSGAVPKPMSPRLSLAHGSSHSFRLCGSKRQAGSHLPSSGSACVWPWQRTRNPFIYLVSPLEMESVKAMWKQCLYKSTVGSSACGPRLEGRGEGTEQEGHCRLSAASAHGQGLVLKGCCCPSETAQWEQCLSLCCLHTCL